MCPTLDPIQVNTPKEKVVQTFSDKDIEKIVTDGIVNGNIPLPEVEAGSKLYRYSYSTGDAELEFLALTPNYKETSMKGDK